MRLLHILAALMEPPEAKGVAGTLAALSLSDWSSVASVFAGVATGVYMLRKTALLKAPIRADSQEASEN